MSEVYQDILEKYSEYQRATIEQIKIAFIAKLGYIPDDEVIKKHGKAVKTKEKTIFKFKGKEILEFPKFEIKFK